jgi:prolyl oligopeptidase
VSKNGTRVPVNILRRKGTPLDGDNPTLLHGYGGYHQMRDGTPHPAVLLLTGGNDGRVSPANSRKMAARLQQSNASANPILVLLSSAAGHGMGTALAELIAENADVLAFIFDQLRMTQPKTRDSERSV